MLRRIIFLFWSFFRKRAASGHWRIISVPGVELPQKIKILDKERLISENGKRNRTEEAFANLRSAMGKASGYSSSRKISGDGDSGKFDGTGESRESDEADGYIERQYLLTGLKFGFFPMSFCGCEIIAVYNLLKFIRFPTRKSLQELIGAFERDGALFAGEFGTAPQAIFDYLSGLGLSVSRATRGKDFSSLAEQSSAIIFTFLNNKKNIFHEIHTVCVTREFGISDQPEAFRKLGSPERLENPEDLKPLFVVHNGAKGREEYRSWDSLMQGIGDGDGKAGGLYMIGVNPSAA